MFPVNHADAPVSTRLTVLQFLSHLAYHLGQIDDHRRMATGADVSANAIDPTEVLNQLGELDSGVKH